MRRHWVIAPYDSTKEDVFNKVWGYDLKNGTIAIGWTELGDVSKNSEEELKAKIRKIYPDSSLLRTFKSIWKFYHEISVGDVILARKGRKTIIGIGEVIEAAFYDESEGRKRIGDFPVRAYSNFIRIKWEEKNIDFDKIVFAMNTLYEISDVEYNKLLTKEIVFERIEEKSTEILKLIQEFRDYLTSEDAKSHLDYLHNKEHRETREVFEMLKKLKRGSREFVDLVLYGLLPNAKSKFAKRISLAPAFMNIKKFFSRFGYTDNDWIDIADVIFTLFMEFEENPKNLQDSIKKFISNKYSKALQCGSITPVFYSLSLKYPIVNNRVIRTYKTLSAPILGRRDELNRNLSDYITNIDKVKEFIKILVKNYDFKEIEDLAIFDLLCYWFDEHFKKEKRASGREKKVKEIIKKVKHEDDIFEETEEEQALDISPESKKVIWQPKDYSIRELFNMFKDGDLLLQPKFQRFFVWDDKKSSRLIESIFLDVPIPVIYLAEEQNGKFTIIDGQQRLTSFFDFIDGKLKLKNLLVFSDLNNKKYQELDDDLKSKYKKATLHIIIIKKESQEDIRFEIFERLNTGSVKLNDQELRNCIYRGGYNDFLEELSCNKDFLFLLGLNEPHKRMVDRELILRFFAFYHKTHLKYDSPMKSFLNREIGAYGELESKEKDEMKRLFEKSIELTKHIFGDNAFKRFMMGNDSDPNGIWEKRKVNKSLFDIIMYGFTDYEKHQIIPNCDSIREELIWLMSYDKEFIDSIIISTNDKSKVLCRFEKWISSLRKIIGYPEKEPRCFSSQIKKGLFNSSSICALCKQEIKFLDDAEVDHVEFYWRGGATIPSNARLVHRYCNRARDSHRQ